MRAVELFCGAGGLSRGLMDAWIQVVAAFDHKPEAIEVYNRNVGAHGEVMDLSKVLEVIRKVKPHNPDLVCGGPPCQDFSKEGLQVEGERALLTVAYATVIVAVRPQWFLMENVPEALESDAWKEAKAILKSAGYGMSSTVVDCSRYGVGQARRRAIVIGRLGERDGFMDSEIAKRASPTQMSIREALRVKRFDRDSEFLKRDDNQAMLAKAHVFLRPRVGRQNVRSIDVPLPTITRRSDEAPGPRHFKNPHPKDTVPIAEAHVMTVRQYSRLNGFRANWNWGNIAKHKKMLMIANAVPAPAARRIGAAIVARHLGKSMPEIEGNFRQWLRRKKRVSAATAANRISLLKKGRALLGGRTFDVPAMEIATLEATPRFAALDKNERSGIRSALSQYAEYLDMKAKRGTEDAPWTGLTVMDVEPRNKPRKLAEGELRAMMQRLASRRRESEDDCPDEISL